MKLNRLIIIALCTLAVFSCKNVGRVVPSATGTIYECLVVCDNNLWNGQTGKLLKESMSADMPCLPQPEPMLSLSHVTPANFDQFLMSTRNLLVVDLDPHRYTTTKLVKETNLYAKPQAYARIQSQHKDSLVAYLKDHAAEITQYFVNEELKRQSALYTGATNTDACAAVKNKFGADINIPSDYLLIRNNAELVWSCNSNGAIRRDMIVYSYPYNGEALTYEYLLSKRDSVMKANVEGAIAGSYMGTEYNEIPPVMKKIAINGKQCTEIRGLWTLYNGGAMGGPFVQHTYLDTKNQRVIVAEIFIFAAGQKKRNPYRQAEAILYTFKPAL